MQPGILFQSAWLTNSNPRGFLDLILALPARHASTAGRLQYRFGGDTKRNRGATNPLDDPAASLIMDCPGGIRGAKLWQRLQESPYWENPDWSAYFVDPVEMESSGEPQIEDLSLGQAVELSLIHSREYQQQLENLYLAALALTFERFRFQVRPFGFVGDEPSIHRTHS